MNSLNPSFGYNVIQGRTRGRARLVKITGVAALIVTDYPLTLGKRIMLARSAGADPAKSHRPVQVHASVEKGDHKKLGYVVRLLHAQCPSGLEVLLSFLQEELGVVTANPAVGEAANGQSGPVTFRFDTQSFEMGGAVIEKEPPAPQLDSQPAPKPRSLPMAEDAVEPESGQSPQRLPSLEGDPDELVSMFGMKVKRGEFDRLGDLPYKPGGVGKAVRSVKRDDPAAEEDTSSKKKGLFQRVVRKFSE